MNERDAAAYREITPATAALCHVHLAELRKEVNAAYVRQHADIQQTGEWHRLPRLFAQGAGAYMSLFMLGALMPFNRQNAIRHNLDRILRFATRQR